MVLRSFKQLAKATRTQILSSSTKNVRTLSSFRHAADKMRFTLPEESDSLNISFNWSLAADDVTPAGDAYRNLQAKRILNEFIQDMKPNGKKFEMKEVDVDASFPEYQELYESVTDHLSRESTLFTHDGAVGSYKEDRTRVRIITDSPIVALFAQNLLVRVPIKDPHVARPMVVYIATRGKFQNIESTSGVLLIEEAEKNININYENPEKKENLCAKLVIAGQANLDSLQKAIGTMKQRLDAAHEEASSVVLPADVIYKNNSSVLLFNASPELRTKYVQDGILYGGHLAIWNTKVNGVTSFFGGAIVKSPPTLPRNSKAAPLVLESGNTLVNVPCQNLVDAPKSMIFITKDASGEINAENAGKLLLKVDPNADVEKFQELIKGSGTKVYAVSKESQVDDIVAKL